MLWEDWLERVETEAEHSEAKDELAENEGAVSLGNVQKKWKTY